jgi:hypothetical protein
VPTPLPALDPADKALFDKANAWTKLNYNSPPNHDQIKQLCEWYRVAAAFRHLIASIVTTNISMYLTRHKIIASHTAIYQLIQETLGD